MTTRLTQSVIDRLRSMPARTRNALLVLLGLGGAGTGTYVYTRPDRPPQTRPPPVDPSGVLAKVRVAPPSGGLHLIRANVPFPASAQESVHLQDRNGRALPTQIDVVTRGPKDEPRMVEVMALAETGAGTQEFAVVAGASPSGPPAPTDVDLTLHTTDHTGARFDSVDATSTLARSGPVVVTDERRGYLRSADGTPLLGFILAETAVAGEDFTLCELVVHNGPVPVAGDAYFRDLRVAIPAGQVVSYLLPQPWADSSGTLIRANQDGTYHVMLQKQSVEFRFVVHEPADSARATAALRMDGFGVCVPGPGLWSPQNPATPWYFPQGAPMPMPVAGMNFDTYPYSMTLAGMQGALASGAPFPNGQNAGAAGPYHPWGSSYGGVTGGDGIWQYDGLAVLLTGRADKLHEVMAYHRGITDRHRTAIFDAQGGVQKIEDVPPCKVAASPGTMWGGKEGAFTWKTASPWRYDQVKAAGKLPTYDGYLRGFDPQDFQHHVRRTAASCALVWLCNDSIGRWALEQEAEWARMYAYEIGEGELAAADAKSKQYPGKGAFGGRDAGWARFAVGAWYQVAPDRERFKAWMATDIAVLERAQLPSGGWLAHESGKPTDGFGSDATTQAIEDGINIGAGIQACYGATGDARYAAILRNAGDRYAYHWAFGKGSPFTRDAVRPKDPSLPAYTLTNKPQPVVFDLDNWQSSSLLYAALAAGSAKAEAMVKDMLGPDPLASMLAKPMDKLDNRAPLMAWYQLGGAR